MVSIGEFEQVNPNWVYIMPYFFDCYRLHCSDFSLCFQSQYTFIYDALLDSYICGNTEIAPADLVAKMRFLNEKDPSTGDTNFVEEFKVIVSFFPYLIY